MNYERFELPNGLRVLAAPMPSMRSATCAVFLNVGSRAESDGEAGIAHLIEHLLFKGTRRRPSSRLISETLERVGGILNASTDKEATVFWTKTASQHVELSIDLLADMLQNSRITSHDLKKEQTVIVEELGMSMDDPQDWIHTLTDQIMWPGHPLGREVAGTKDSVRGLSRGQVRRFMSSFYGPNNAVLTVAGGIDPQKIHDMALAHFGDWLPVQPAPFLPWRESPAPAFHLDPRPTEQVHVCLAYPGLSRYDDDRYALDILATILGGSTTSRLFLEIRERLALAYDIHVYTNKLADTGSIVIYAGVDPSHGHLALDAILGQLDRIGRRSVSHQELTKTMEYMKGRLFLGLEDTHAVTSWLGSQELLMGEIESPEAVVKALEAVRTRDVRRVARDLLTEENVRLAAIGPNAADLAGAVAA